MGQTEYSTMVPKDRRYKKISRVELFCDPKIFWGWPKNKRSGILWRPINWSLASLLRVPIRSLCVSVNVLPILERKFRLPGVYRRVLSSRSWNTINIKVFKAEVLRFKLKLVKVLFKRSEIIIRFWNLRIELFRLKWIQWQEISIGL